MGDEGDIAYSSSLLLGDNKIRKKNCLQQTQTYFEGGGEGGGGRRPKMGADMLRENDGKTSGERGKRRREMEVDGSEQRRTAADSGGQRRTVADVDGGQLRQKKAVCW
jgi:hypothetical protein